MLIEYHGHSEFLLTSESGVRILTDPYDAHVGYAMRACPADVVTVSHSHGDHSEAVKGGAQALVVRDTAPVSAGADVRLYGVPTWHDGERGARRGGNIVFVIEINGLRVVHLGDLGHELDEQSRFAIGQADILLVPVGGFYTIDAAQAARVAQSLHPRVVIPMHYRTSVNAGWPIAPVDEFLQIMGVQNAQNVALLRVTAADISEQPALAVLAYC